MQREELSCSGNLDISNHIRKRKGRHAEGTVREMCGFEFELLFKLVTLFHASVRA